MPTSPPIVPPRSHAALRRLFIEYPRRFSVLRPSSVHLDTPSAIRLAEQLVAPHVGAATTSRVLDTLFQLDHLSLLEVLRLVRRLPPDHGWRNAQLPVAIRDAAASRTSTEAEIDAVLQRAARVCDERGAGQLLLALALGHEVAVEALEGSASDTSAAKVFGCPPETFPLALKQSTASGFIGTGATSAKVEDWWWCNWKIKYDYPNNPLKAIFPITPGAIAFVYAHGFKGQMKGQTHAMAVRSTLAATFGMGALGLAPLVVCWVVLGIG